MSDFDGVEPRVVEDPVVGQRNHATTIATVVDVLSVYPSPPGLLTRMMVTDSGTATVVASLDARGFKGTPGPTMRAGEQVLVNVLILAEERGFRARPDNP